MDPESKNGNQLEHSGTDGRSGTLGAGRIAATFRRLADKGEKALIPYITAGDPDLATTRALILEMERSGADLIELGVPFSDPSADGPTIQEASVRALGGGVRLPAILDLVSALRRETEIPIVLFGYYNPFLRYGIERLARDAVQAGVDGFLVVDLPPEESDELQIHLKPLGPDFIFLLAPTTPPDRVQLIARKAGGFLYTISLTGVTGARDQLPEELEGYVAGIRGAVDLPVAVGFGISTPQQAAMVAAMADGVVVGSALVRRIHESAPGEEVRNAGELVQEMKEAMGGR